MYTRHEDHPASLGWVEVIKSRPTTVSRLGRGLGAFRLMLYSDSMHFVLQYPMLFHCLLDRIRVFKYPGKGRLSGFISIRREAVACIQANVALT